MAWYYHQNGTNQGPVEASDLQGLVASGTLSPDTLVWTEGLPTWVPYQSSAAAPLKSGGAVAVVTHVCAECKKSFRKEDMLQYENSWVCASCKPLFFQRVKEGVVPVGVLKYATIGARFAAVFIDGLIIIVLTIIPQILLYGGWSEYIGRMKSDVVVPVWVTVVSLLLSYVFPAAFETFFIGKFGATPGKMLLKVKVVMPDGGRVSYLRALGRHFAKFLSGILLYIGYLMAFWDDEKRALHDRICTTRVIVDDSR